MPAKMKPGIEGLEAVLAGFWKVKGSTAKGAEKGLKKAGAFLLRESKKLVPVEFGPLKASGFVRVTGEGFQTRVAVGYTAFYAPYVHEAVAMKLKGKPRPSGRGKYWDPKGARAKFLEGPSRDLQPQLRKIIYGEFLK